MFLLLGCLVLSLVSGILYLLSVLVCCVCCFCNLLTWVLNLVGLF